MVLYVKMKDLYWTTGLAEKVVRLTFWTSLLLNLLIRLFFVCYISLWKGQEGI